MAIAALIVSVSALGVGAYEAQLQRQHDRAEVWPHLEIQTFVGDSGANITVENTGLGPAVVEAIDVATDGRPQHNWIGAMEGVLPDSLRAYSNNTVYEHGVRPGDHVVLLGLPRAVLPSPFWKAMNRIVVTICYRSVFGERWIVGDTLGLADHWTDAHECPPQRPKADF